MSNLLHRWRRFPLWLPGIFLSLFFSLLAAPVWWLWCSPVQQNGVRLTLQYRQQTGHYQRLLHSLAARGPLADIASDIAQLRQAVTPDRREIFSLQKLIEVSNSSLMEWQPASQKGALLLNWSQVHSVFDYFSSLSSGMALPHFTLKPEKQQLRLQLSLVVNHED